MTITTTFRWAADHWRDLTGWLFRKWADLRRQIVSTDSTASLVDTLASGAPRGTENWVARTAERHDAYRASIEPVDADVAIVCSSNRPGDLPNLIESVARQRHEALDMVFVAHGRCWDIEHVEEAFAALDSRLRRIRVLAMPEELSLGACLNAGFAATDARFVAKFDSDDHYGTEYLPDALRAHAYAGAGIVGKHSYFVHVEYTDEYWMRFPGNEFRYTGTLAGGTLLIDRDVVDDQRFADLSLGEDREFLRRAHRRGISTFASDRFNYTLVRSDQNTWRVPITTFLKGAIAVAATDGDMGIDR